jgi:hypothetical protein
MRRNAANPQSKWREGQYRVNKQQIAEKFLGKLVESKAMDPGKLDQLRGLLADNKKPKADDFVKIFSEPVGGDLK